MQGVVTAHQDLQQSLISENARYEMTHRNLRVVQGEISSLSGEQ